MKIVLAKSILLKSWLTGSEESSSICCESFRKQGFALIITHVKYLVYMNTVASGTPTLYVYKSASVFLVETAHATRLTYNHRMKKHEVIQKVVPVTLYSLMTLLITQEAYVILFWE